MKVRTALVKLQILLILVFVLCSCSGKKELFVFGESETFHASLLEIFPQEDNITICRIKNPWREGEFLAQYALAPKSLGEIKTESIEERFGKSIVLRTPLDKITLTSACHAYLLNQIGALDNVKVMCDAEYVINDELKEIISSGKIVSAGSSMNPTVEVILAQGSDSFWMNPFESTTESFISSLPLPLIYCADYMETTPLGRAEWMRFYGLLVDKKTEADSLFAIVEKNYDAIKNENKQHKSLFAELPYQSTWYVPGGNSTMGIMYKNAGFDYVWAEDTHSGSLALSPEAVLHEAHDADVWVIKYMSDKDWTKEDLLSQDKLYSQFKAAKDGEIYGCNTMLTDFYDVTPFRPDILLDELNSLGKHYFKKIE